jgi:hypothetical protein
MRQYLSSGDSLATRSIRVPKSTCGYISATEKYLWSKLKNIEVAGSERRVEMKTRQISQQRVTPHKADCAGKERPIQPSTMTIESGVHTGHYLDAGDP